MRRTTIVSILMLTAFLVCIPLYATGAESPLLKEGIRQYQDENYEEAVEVLEQARARDPQSSAAAFFLGLAYKQTIDYPKAMENFKDAVTLTPRIKEALVELIEMLYRVPGEGNLEEAAKWIETAEKEKISPAKIAFLKGLVLQKKGENMASVAAFEQAKTLDPNLAQAAELQIGLGYLQERMLKIARDRFQAAILQDPQTDLATFARNYLDLIERRIEQEKPIRVTLGLFGQYNTNLTSKPSAKAQQAAFSDEESRTLVPTLRVDYVPRLEGPWLFNAQYAFSGAFNENWYSVYDSLTNSIVLTPGYNYGESALNLVVAYSHSLLRNPHYQGYMDMINVGPLYRMLVAEEHILEFFAGYNHKEYFQPPLRPEEDRDANAVTASVGWIWLYRENGFFNLKYEYTDESTDGDWWDYIGHRFSVNLAYPLTDTVQLQASYQAFLQDYQNVHLLLNNLDKRTDDTFSGSLGVTWEFRKNTSLIAQYTKTRVDSNIPVYDYQRQLYNIGIEYRF